MSPKKYVGGRRNDKKRKDETVKLSELDKQTYTLHIKDLEIKLDRSQKKCREVELASQSYKTELEALSSDKKDIVAYLQRMLDQRADEIQELQERLDGLHFARDTDRQAHEQEINALKSQFQEVKDQLTSENIVLSGKLSSLEEFKARKEEMSAKIKELQEKLAHQEEEHCEKVRLIEKNAILEKDRLKGEMMKNLAVVGTRFRQISNRQMAETTRRAIQENAALSAQTEAMARKMNAVVVENQNLAECKREQQLRISYLKGMEEDFQKRNIYLAKIVKDLQLKLCETEDKVLHLKPSLTKIGLLEDELSVLKIKMQSLRLENVEKQAECEELKKIVDAIKVKLEDVQGKKTTFENVLRNAAHLLRHGLLINKEIASEETFCDVNAREGTLNGLLDILNSLDESPDVSSVQHLPLLGVDPANSQAVVNYSVGDIGIIPRSKKTKPVFHRPPAKTQATQTELRLHSSFHPPRVPPILRRATRSAAFKILHQMSCSTRNFISKDDVLLQKRYAIQ